VNVIVRVSKSFKIAAKPLLKKFPSLQKDLLKLEGELIKNPTLGTPLGHNAYKIRLKITSKGKGKSGGARVISLIEKNLIAEIVTSEEYTIVNLIMIYDKADTATITDKELKDLIKTFNSEK
jgi:mRNA-degrading endonuclease RelE of RelBE toxin-antitoxin system